MIMARQGGKNPYVHPDEKNHMLNTVGNDGWSYDEKDDDEEDLTETVAPADNRSHSGISKAEFDQFAREAKTYEALGLDNPLSDGHYEALGLEAPGE
jgi:hypothetical protein